MFEMLREELGKPKGKGGAGGPSGASNVAVVQRNMLKDSYTKPANGFMKQERKTKRAKKESAKRTLEFDGLFSLSALEVGDVVGIISPHPRDKFNIKLPGANLPIFALFVTEINMEKREVSGHPYMGLSGQKLKFTGNVIEKVVTSDIGIVHIWSMDDDPADTFKMDACSIKDIVEYINSVYKVNECKRKRKS